MTHHGDSPSGHLVRHADVTIMGNGLSANLFARHLKLTHPEMTVLIVGEAATPHFTVGESITELGSHYLQHRLKLTSYLYRHQLVKQGIRLFFDNAEHNAPLEEMSEEGTGFLSTYNTFHIDRYHFETDLKVMNADMGVDYLDDVVEDVTFDPLENRLSTVSGCTVASKWLVDATGMRRFLSRILDLQDSVPHSVHCSTWAHFCSRNQIDTLNPEWRRSNVFTTREFSTIHFVYPHYWFWVIPLRDDVMSCGVVYDSRYLFQEKSPSQSEFVEFIQQHQALASIFEKFEVVNFRSARNYSYAAKQTISLEKRFILLGESGSFIDPLYSHGVDILAQQSDFWVDILGRDRVGDDSLPRCVDQANSLVKRAYRHYSALILGQNLCLGSAEIFGLKYFFEFYTYFIFKLWPYLSKHQIHQLYNQDDELQRLMDLLTGQFLMLAERYQQRGLYGRKNSGWRQGAHLGFSLRHILSQRLNDRLLQRRFRVFHDLVRFVCLRQMELFFERQDLLHNPFFQTWLGFDKVTGCLPDAVENREVLFQTMQQQLSSDSDLSDSEYWALWLKRMHSESDLSFIQNCHDFQAGQLIFERPEQDFPDYPDPILSAVVTYLQRAQDQCVDFFQQEIRIAGHLTPFEVEGAACGLFLNAERVESVHQKITEHTHNQDFRPLVMAACGMAHQQQVMDTLDMTRWSDLDLSWFLNGYGLQMGLRYWRGECELVFPGADRRAHLVRGLGRAVTFIPNEENTPEKYAKYFRFFSLFPEDRDNFYYGAGFSLSFTRSPAVFPEFLAHIQSLFENVPATFEEGVYAALSYKAKLLPDLYFPLTLLLPKAFERTVSTD